jgi:hypothetical protein
MLAEKPRRCLADVYRMMFEILKAAGKRPFRRSVLILNRQESSRGIAGPLVPLTPRRPSRVYEEGSWWMSRDYQQMNDEYWYIGCRYIH